MKQSSLLCVSSLPGGAAAALTNPLDIAKTRLQTQGMWEPAPVDAIGGGPAKATALRGPVSGATQVLPTLREIVAKEGVAALARGMGPRVLFHVPVRDSLSLSSLCCPPFQ